MDIKLKALQWRVPYFASNRLVDINGCINQRVGGHMPRDINKRTMVTGGTESSHQRTRAERSAFNYIDFYKIPNSSEDTHTTK